MVPVRVVRLDIELKVGGADQTVEVTAAAPILSTETSSLSTIETGQRIVNLPLNGPTPLSFPMTRPIQVPEDRGRIAFTIPRTSPMTSQARQRSGARPPESQTLTCFYNPAAFVIPDLAPGQTFAHQFGNSGKGSLRGTGAGWT